MSKIVQVKRNPTPLTEQVWTFLFFEDRMLLCLDGYCEGVRGSTRKRTYVSSPGQTYYRLSHRGAGMREEDVPMPADVVEEAYQSFVKEIRVGLWERDYKGPERAVLAKIFGK